MLRELFGLSQASSASCGGSHRGASVSTHRSFQLPLPVDRPALAFRFPLPSEPSDAAPSPLVRLLTSRALRSKEEHLPAEPELAPRQRALPVPVRGAKTHGVLGHGRERAEDPFAYGSEGGRFDRVQDLERIGLARWEPSGVDLPVEVVPEGGPTAQSFGRERMG